MSNELRRLAVLMGSHQRLGKDSLLSSLDLSVLGTIAEMSLGPQNIWTRVLYPAKDGTGENDQVAPDDSMNGIAIPTPFVCTVLEKGTPVFRGPIYRSSSGISIFQIMPRKLEYGKRQVLFSMRFPKTMFDNPEDPPVINEFVRDTRARHSIAVSKFDFYRTQEKLVAFKAFNDLGIEVRLSTDLNEPFIPARETKPALFTSWHKITMFPSERS